jgi:hypothetical protein
MFKTKKFFCQAQNQNVKFIFVKHGCGYGGEILKGYDLLPDLPKDYREEVEEWFLEKEKGDPWKVLCFQTDRNYVVFVDKKKQIWDNLIDSQGQRELATVMGEKLQCNFSPIK